MTPLQLTLFVLCTNAMLTLKRVQASYGPLYRRHHQPHNRWSGGDDPPLPPRIRMGEGRYKMERGKAQLICQFPESVSTLSNVIWERADLGNGKSLDDMYNWAGHVQRYTVYLRPSGSTLMLESVVPQDRGLYRCIVTARQPTTNKLVTIFQDVFFYPQLERLEMPPRHRPHDHHHQQEGYPPLRPMCSRIHYED